MFIFANGQICISAIFYLHYSIIAQVYKWDATAVITALFSANFPVLFCTFDQRNQIVGVTTHLVTFLFFTKYLLNIPDIVLPHSLQYSFFMCCVLIIGSFLWCAVR